MAKTKLVEERLGPQHIGKTKPTFSHPVKKLILDRLASGSKRGSRTDGAILAIAIEGGGIGGIVSAGMCVALEVAGMIDAVDIIYGSSSGALNGAFTTSSQAEIGSDNYIKVMDARFYNPRRFVRRRPIVDFDFLFNEVIQENNPYDFEAFKKGPEFRAMATSLSTQKGVTLSGFKSVDDLMLAIRASCSIPVAAGPAMVYKDDSLVDGALIYSVPFRPALEEGATHVLALRTKHESYRISSYNRTFLRAVRRFGSQELADLVRRRPTLYNHDADELQASELQNVLQITPQQTEFPVKQFEKSYLRARQGFDLGVQAIAEIFDLPTIQVSWRPVLMVN
jgi:predicted patatin/cPLA2 family phospholipase